MTTLVLNRPTHSEDIEYENKRFSLAGFTSDNSWRDYVEQFDRGDVGQLLMMSLHRNIGKYCSKYIAAFANGNIDGKLVFGVDDDTTVTGIPVPPGKIASTAPASTAPAGDATTSDLLTEDRIRSVLHSVVRKNVRSATYDSEQIMRNIDIHLVPVLVDHDTIPPDRLDEILERHQCKQNDWEKRNERHRSEYLTWLNNIHFYKQKLSIVVDDVKFRKEFCDYLRLSLVTYPFSAERLVRFIEQVERGPIPLDPSEEIRSIQSNPDNIFYWIMKFRDWKTEALSGTKPRRPIRSENTIDMKAILSNHVEFQHRFVSRGYCYYVIEFHIHGSRFRGSDFFFRIPKRWWETGSRPKQKWKYRTRVMTNQGPGCV